MTSGGCIGSTIAYKQDGDLLKHLPAECRAQIVHLSGHEVSFTYLLLGYPRNARNPTSLIIDRISALGLQLPLAKNSMSLSTDSSKEIIPAQLGYLAIYNPTIGSNDESLENQIVYYYSAKYSKKSQTRSGSKRSSRDSSRRQRIDEQLRQIGLGQGMIEFAKNFSCGQPVDTIDTKKSRIILHEFEANWWILASINFTAIPGPSRPGKALEQQGSVEYSSRNVKPAAILLVDLVRAHSTFLLHHASSMSSLYEQTTRTRLLSLIGRYWDVFLSTWSVFMHGNPINTVYHGIKVAACGELGIGVGEEDRGSGEREVLEGFVGRVQGVLDVVVSKFGDVTAQDNSRLDGAREIGSQIDEQWIGSGNDPSSEDGAIFLGAGAISRRSLRDITHWIEDIYRWGSYTYGIVNNPNSDSRSRKSRKHANPLDGTIIESTRELQGNKVTSQSRNDNSRDKHLSTQEISVPMPNNQSLEMLSVSKTRDKKLASDFKDSRSESDGSFNFGTYLKFGYGTHWKFGRNFSLTQSETSSLHDSSTLDGDQSLGTESTNKNKSYASGYFLIGFNEIIDESIMEDSKSVSATYVDSDERESKILHRNLILELNQEHPQVQARMNFETDQIDNKETLKTKSFHNQASEALHSSLDNNFFFFRLPVVVFVYKPFIFIFLFEPETETLKLTSLYSSLRHQIQPIIKPLLVSTSYRASRPQAPTLDSSNAPIYDLIWDPDHLTIHSTIPDIPDPSTYQLDNTWSRMEALNIHMQIIRTYISSRDDSFQLERTSKTSQGWWIVWTKVFDPRFGQSQGKLTDSVDPNETEASLKVQDVGQDSSSASLNSLNQSLRLKCKEILLIRKASDHVGVRSMSRLSSAPLGSENNWTFEPGRLAQGIGIDTKRYIEGLLSLNL